VRTGDRERRGAANKGFTLGSVLLRGSPVVLYLHLDLDPRS